MKTNRRDWSDEFKKEVVEFILHMVNISKRLPKTWYPMS